MADKLLIIMVNSDPEQPAELAPAFSQALSAVAMKRNVEIVMAGRAGRLALQGVAERIVSPNVDGSFYDVIKKAHAAGVTFKICSAMLDEENLVLIPEIEEIVGGAYIISEAMDDDTITLTY